MVMVLLGGIQTLTGPIVGAAVFTVLQDNVMRQTTFWRGLLGVVPEHETPTACAFVVGGISG